MATPPTRVSYNVPSVGYTSASPKTTPTFDVQAGDLLTVLGSTEDSGVTLSTPTTTGSITWTLRQSVIVSGYCAAYAWTGVVNTTQTGITVSVARASGTGQQVFGFAVTVWRNHGGVGATAKGNSSGAPSLAVTCSDNSAVTYQNGDWNAVSSARTWRTVNGAPMTESLYQFISGRFTAYGSYTADVGAAGSKTLGLTAPTGQKFSNVAVEVLGTAGSTPNTGSASGTVSWAGSAAGRKVTAGLAAGAIAWAGVATGSAPHKGSASGTIAWHGTATGKATHQGASSGGLAWSGAATGSAPTVGAHQGSASGSLTWAGAATGEHAAQGSASGTLSWAGSATGVAPTVGAKSGSASGTVSWAGTASGTTTRKGSGSGAVTWSGSATGQAPIPGVKQGSAAGGVLWHGAATGTAAHRGAAVGAITWHGVATGSRTATGTAAGTLLWTGAATGSAPNPNDATPDPSARLTLTAVPALTLDAPTGRLTLDPTPRLELT